jgi:four helix bundle protein
MTPQELRERTRDFALRVQRFCRPLLRTPETQDAARQLTRAGASVAANYRAVGLARSRVEFLAKLGVVLEEADESGFWARYLRDAGHRSAELDAIIEEARQLAAIFGASRRTARANAATAVRQSHHKRSPTTR